MVRFRFVDAAMPILVLKREDVCGSVALSNLVNELGRASATAQGLKRSVTGAHLLRDSDTLYLLQEGSEGIGLLKLGRRRLFVAVKGTQLVETNALCVLDFFTATNRAGHGISLFNHMLKCEGVHPWNLAFDRPSAKMVSFLARHFSLRDGQLQANKFFLFPQFEF